jgi:signal transduction histidine kinase
VTSQPGHSQEEKLGKAAAPVPGPVPEPQTRATAAWPPSDAAALELALQELVKYFRHSGAGRLVAGIVHQMNSPLQVLSFQLELLEQKAREELEILAGCSSPAAARLLPLSNYRQEKLRQFRAEVDRLQTLARRLVRQGIHEDTQDKQPLNLNELIEEELTLYQANPFFKHQVRREWRLKPGLPLVYGHYLDFSQSWRNLLDNALQALEEVERREVQVVTAYEDRRLTLALGDTGLGIPPEVRPWLFQPFVTTKQGHAGLGLFMAQRLLAPYGAEIRVERLDGVTWVKVAMPAA